MSPGLASSWVASISDKPKINSKELGYDYLSLIVHFPSDLTEQCTDSGTENYQSVWHQMYYDATHKINNIRFEGLYIITTDNVYIIYIISSN